MRPARLATVSLLCAGLGAVTALAIARGVGWLGSSTTQTVVVPAASQPRAVSEQTILRSAGMRPAGHVYVEFADRDRVSARVVGWDVFDDVGLLKVDPKEHRVAPVPLGDSSAIVVGEPVAAIGAPFGNADSLATGVVSAIHRSINSLTSSFSVPDAIQTDAPINHGNSGGPLFDARGRVIGINAQIRSDSGNAEGVGFAVPIDAARRSMEQLIATGRVLYPYVGVNTQDLTPSAAEHFGFG